VERALRPASIMATRIARTSGLFTTTFGAKRDSLLVYDLVTTSVYLPKDSMALTLDGTAKWASAKELQDWARRRWEPLLHASGKYSNA
jgi:hypothetical protein